MGAGTHGNTDPGGGTAHTHSGECFQEAWRVWNWATWRKPVSHVKKFGLDPGCTGGPAPVFCNIVMHQTGASHQLAWKSPAWTGGRSCPVREGLFRRGMQDALPAGPKEMDSPLPEQELGG